MTRIQGPHGDETESWVNQRRDEPLPTSHHDDPDQEAVARNEEHAGARPEAARPEAARPDDGPGKAVRDMMPGPAPQGDVPDAPGVQVAAAEDPGRDDDRPGPVRRVANAVPGRPDGEVDTRP
ncbi:MAG TPA: hypothetical protein VGN41_02105 [Streptosporangiaceae bacterium]|jgi:hypothetical protein